MINKIANLSAELRMEGLPVSIRSTQAAVKIYMDLGGDDRNLLKTALMSIYVKDRYGVLPHSENLAVGAHHWRKGGDLQRWRLVGAQ